MKENKEDYKEDSELLHARIHEALQIIQEALVENDLALFPSICAMLTIIHTYETENAQAKSVIEAYKEVLKGLRQAPEPATEILH